MDRYVFVMDLDGVLTSGNFLYDANGKAYKAFGPDDADALKLIQEDVSLAFLSADHRGFSISSKRISDMGYVLNLVPAKERLDWLKARFDLTKVIYMGDSFVDLPVFRAVGCSIATSDSFYLAKENATYITRYPGGRRAVADAVFYIAQKFLGKSEYELLRMERPDLK